jgi:hypothetical protein
MLALISDPNVVVALNEINSTLNEMCVVIFLGFLLVILFCK